MASHYIIWYNYDNDDHDNTTTNNNDDNNDDIFISIASKKGRICTEENTVKQAYITAPMKVMM